MPKIQIGCDKNGKLFMNVHDSETAFFVILGMTIVSLVFILWQNCKCLKKPGLF